MFLGLAVVAGLASLVCWIMVLIKIFQDGKIGLGVLGIICPLFAFIYGWVRVSDFGMQTIMLVWSVAIAVGIGNNILFRPTVTTTNGGNTVITTP